MGMGPPYRTHTWDHWLRAIKAFFSPPRDWAQYTCLHTESIGEIWRRKFTLSPHLCNNFIKVHSSMGLWNLPVATGYCWDIAGSLFLLGTWKPWRLNYSGPYWLLVVWLSAVIFLVISFLFLLVSSHLTNRALPRFDWNMNGPLINPEPSLTTRKEMVKNLNWVCWWIHSGAMLIWRASNRNIGHNCLPYKCLASRWGHGGD